MTVLDGNLQPEVESLGRRDVEVGSPVAVCRPLEQLDALHVLTTLVELLRGPGELVPALPVPRPEPRGQRLHPQLGLRRGQP